VSGSVEWAYDNSFRVVTEAVNGALAAAFTYEDGAGLIVVFWDESSIACGEGESCANSPCRGGVVPARRDSAV
jgi:hypothetical protein